MGRAQSGVPLPSRVRNNRRLFTVTFTTMKKPLIEYYQEVLSKISYADRAVFRKELRKAFRHLVPDERETLKEWFRTACVCKTGIGTRFHGAGLQRQGELN